jgi:cell wall assembly regulator SMI1
MDAAAPLPELSLQQVWTSIAAWLAAHGAEHASSPAMPGTLRPGAAPEALAAAEAALGVALPDQLRELWQLVDGQEYDESVYEFPLAPWGRLLPVADSLQLHGVMDRVVDATAEEFGMDADDVPGDYRVPEGHLAGAPGAVVLATNPRWVPFAECPSGGGGPPVLFFVDADPPPGVPPGRVLCVGGEGSPLQVMAPCLRDMLADVLAAMRRREPDDAGAGGGGGGGGDDDDDGGNNGGGGKGGARRHRKVLYDDGPRIWYRYSVDGQSE